MIPTREQDVVATNGALTLTLLAKQFIAQNGPGPGTIRAYGLVQMNNENFEIDAILGIKDGIEAIDFFDIFDTNGYCLNEGEPIYPEDTNNPDAILTLERLRTLIETN